MQPRTMKGMQRRMDEINGFIKGIKPDTTPAARAEYAELKAGVQAAGKRNIRAAQKRGLLRGLTRRG